MKSLKIQNGGHGGRHIANSYHVTKKVSLIREKIAYFPVSFDMHHFSMT